MKGLTAQLTRIENGTIFALAGTIDEEADFGTLEIGDSKLLIFDLQKVTRINSIGIRSWIIWFNQFSQEVKIIFRNCPKSIVDQFNIVENLLPSNALVESFYVVFYCERCDSEKPLLLNCSLDLEIEPLTKCWTLKIPQYPVCLACGKTMELGVHKQSYFRFLQLEKSHNETLLSLKSNVVRA